MHSRFRMKGVLLAALVAVLASVAMPVRASAEPEPGARKKGFRLLARALGAMTINRVYCGMASAGQICVDSTNSSTIGGGFWPKGTPDQYVFNSGLQVAGIVGPDGGPWANDTVGGFFFDPKGTTEHGEEVQPIYNATNSSDLAIWPDAACVPNGDATANLFDPLLQTDPTNPTGCRKSASQGDVWFISSEVNPALTAGRKHPLGVAVETRGMGWNFPTGNEDIIYFIYTFYNITSTNRADYNNIRGSLADILHQRALEFHAATATRGVNLPAGGYTITNLFAAFAADMDVADAGSNYAGVNLPFALGYTYDHAFAQSPGWIFDPSIFASPFFAGAGFVGVKYLSSPTGPGEIQLFSNTVNGQPFAGAVNDPRDVSQLYRYLSGTLSPATGDQPCNTGNPFQTHICFVNNTQSADMRFFQSSTPLTLAPGEGGSIVVAYIFAAPVQTAGVIACGASCDIKPGDGRILTDAATLVTGANPVDSITGFLGYTDGTPARPADGIVQQDEFRVVPRSLLGKALTAQAVFDAKFLLPFAPDPPDFYLIPGNNQVTVLWKPTSSETTGDPFFAVASSALDASSAPNPLYNPNYRQFDVEGYRVYRGRVDAPNEMTLLAQFDYAGTLISDYTGTINPTADCAPEFSPPLTTGCPGLVANVKDGTVLTAHRDFDLVGDVIQVQAGKGRLLLGNGEALVTAADTAVTGGGNLGGCGPRSACPGLTNGGVPFAYIDATPRNNFRYFYSVTAFDVNSVESGPTSLESPRSTKSVTPVRPAGDFVEAELSFGLFGDDGVKLDPTAPWGIDAATGRFQGPPPPTDALSAVFEPLVPALLPALNLTARVDSLLVHAAADFPCGAAENGLNSCYEAFVTFDRDGTLTQFSTLVHWPVWSSFDGVSRTTPGLGALQIAPDANAEARYSVPTGVARFNAVVGTTLNQYIEFSSFEGQAARRGLFGTAATNFSAGGSRWFQGADETVDHPTTGIRVGHLPGVDTVWAPINHTDIDPLTAGAQIYANSGAMQCHGYTGAGLARQADVQLTWGANGTIASVRDVTHHVNVDFKPNPQASYGFMGDANGDGTVDWDDFQYLDAFSQNAEFQGFCGHTDPGPGLRAQLTAQPTIGPVSTSQALTNATPTGTGFGLYINGERYIFQLTGGNPPAAGTVWTLRTYAGRVRAANSDGPAPSAYTFSAVPRPPVIPGLQVIFTVPNASFVRPVNAAMLKRVHTVPDPYYVTNAFEQSADNKVIKFVNLPQRAIVRIYSSSGVLVNVLEHNSATAGGEMTWNVRNRNNQVVASGVYFYHIEANGVAGGTARRVGRMTIVNFAQ